MKAIGCYLLFVISLAGMSLSDDDTFSEENKKKFLDHIFDLHNTSRKIMKIKPLIRNESLDKIAHTILIRKLFENKDGILKIYGQNYFSKKYNNNTKLNDLEADFIYSVWYFERFSDFDPVEPPNEKSDASKQIAWEGTEEIGLALERTNDYYAVIAIYTPRYKTSIQGQFASNDSKPPTTDQGEPSVV